MGAWTLETWKLDKNGEATELNMDDLGHITEQIEHGFTGGEIIDEEEEDEEEDEEEEES